MEICKELFQVTSSKYKLLVAQNNEMPDVLVEECNTSKNDIHKRARSMQKVKHPELKAKLVKMEAKIYQDDTCQS